MGELTALPHNAPRPPSCIKGPTSNGRGREGKGKGGNGKGRGRLEEGRGGDETPPLHAP